MTSGHSAFVGSEVPEVGLEDDFANRLVGGLHHLDARKVKILPSTINFVTLCTYGLASSDRIRSDIAGVA